MSHSKNQFVKIRTSAWVPITWWDSKAQKSIIFFMSRKILIINAFRMNMWNTKTRGKLNFDLIVRKNGNPLGKFYIITEYVPQILYCFILVNCTKYSQSSQYLGNDASILYYFQPIISFYIIKLTSTTSHFWAHFTKFKKRACWMRNHLSRWPCTSRCNRVGLIKIFQFSFSIMSKILWQNHKVMSSFLQFTIE